MPGATFTIQPVVSIRSAAGDLVPTASNSVTAAIATGSGTLVGTTTVASVSGVATFTNLSITGQGTGFSLLFTSSGLTSSTSATFNVGVLRGDATDDGAITALDAQVVLQGVGAGQVIDAQIILRKVVGADVSAFCINTVR